jgi:hypothetical protein
MLRSMEDLEDYGISATDGIIGKVEDFYFDDVAWVIRYLIVQTGSWLLSREVLISPVAIGQPNANEKLLPATISKEQIRNSPDIDTKKPVSRQHEIRYLGYYGYPNYWGGSGLWGDGMCPYMMAPSYEGAGSMLAERTDAEKARESEEEARHRDDDPDLRSCQSVEKYFVHATDGDIGHVSGYLIDDETWAIRYLIVDTSNWWLGHQVLIAPQWIHDVSWLDGKVSVNLTRQAVKGAPPYDPRKHVDRYQETKIYDHYGYTRYWAVKKLDQ